MKRKQIFDWSKIDRISIISILWPIYKELTQQKISVFKFYKTISKELKKYLPIITSCMHDINISKGLVFIGGTYYSFKDQENKNSISLDLFFNNKKDKLFLTNRNFKNICTSIADTILHEIIHMRQYRRRNFKILPEYASTADKKEKNQQQSYLGCSDEIDAYGFNIACELLDKFNYDEKKVIKYLDQHQKNKNRKFNSWRMYLIAFDHDHNHKIIKRLKKKVIRYLPHAVDGRPYRNKDWIGR